MPSATIATPDYWTKTYCDSANIGIRCKFCCQMRTEDNSCVFSCSRLNCPLTVSKNLRPVRSKACPFRELRMELQQVVTCDVSQE